MAQPGNLSYSQIQEWLHCRYRHNLTYREGWRSKSDAIPLHLGSFIHEALAAIILRNDPDYAVAGAVSDILDGLDSPIMADLMQATAEQALDIAKRTDEWMGISAGHWETVYYADEPLVEYKMDCPIPGFDAYVGIADWVATHKDTGKTWLIDWKSRGRINDPRTEELNLQLMSYLWMLTREYGIDVDGSAIVQILTKLPAQPKLNKNGSMSRTNISTDWTTYKAALEEHGLDPADYLDMENKLDMQFFDFVELYFSEQEIQHAWQDIILEAAGEIAYSGNRYRSMSPWNCRNCQFKQPCLADLRGHDAQGILEMHYDRRV